MKIKFTKRTIDKLTCSNPQGREFWRDTACRGLVIEVRVSGGKTYYLSYRDERGKQRLFKLANAADITPQQAQQLCDAARNRLAMGEDLSKEREQLRASLTVAEFFDDRYLPYVKGYKRSWATDESLFRTHIQPLIGKKFIDAINSEDITRVLARAAVRLGPNSGNRLLVLMRYIFNLAIRWQITGVVSNPTATHKLKRISNHRERFLSAEETQRLMAAVNLSSNVMLKYIIPFLLLTGARKREALDAKWCDIDRARCFWRIPYTKNGHERHVPLSEAALALLDSVPRRKRCEWIFANPKTNQPYKSIFLSWDKARTAAKLEDVRIHDLRHSFASYLVNSGCSLYEVQKILGHSSVAMTQRYSHLSQSSLLRAVSFAQDYVCGEKIS